MNDLEVQYWNIRRLIRLTLIIWVIFAAVCVWVRWARAECTRPYFDTDATSFVMKCYPRSDMETNPDYLDAQEIIKHAQAIKNRHSKPPCDCCDRCSIKEAEHYHYGGRLWHIQDDNITVTPGLFDGNTAK